MSHSGMQYYSLSCQVLGLSICSGSISVFYIVHGCLLFMWVGKGGRLLHTCLPAIAYLSPGYCIPVSRLLHTCLPAIAHLSPGYCVTISRLLHTCLPSIAYLSRGYCTPVSRLLHNYLPAIAYLSPCILSMCPVQLSYYL